MTPFPVKHLAVNGPVFLLAGAISLLVVLAVLYQGGWRYFTGTLVGLVNLAILGAALFAGFLALAEFWETYSGPVSRRSGHLAWATVMTASSVLIVVYYGVINDESNPVGRFLARLKPPDYR